MELEYIQALIYKLVNDRVSEQTTNNDNLEKNIEKCPHCGSKHIIKNGTNKKHRQKYICRECQKTFSDTTKTIFFHTKSNYYIWRDFIGCEIAGMSLAHEAMVIRKTKTTCFNILYRAIQEQVENEKLSGEIELDSMYVKINLKGTKPYYPTGSEKLRGLSHHKICIVTSVDENDNMVFKVAGLGAESKEYYDQFQKESTIISDGKPSILNFAKENDMALDTIPVVAVRKRYTTKNGNSLGSLKSTTK